MSKKTAQSRKAVKAAIAKYLDMLRNGSRLDQATVGRYVGRDQSAISEWEDPDNKAMPTVDQLAMLCELFGVSADFMLGRAAAFEEGDPIEVVRERALSRRSPTKKRRNSDSDGPPRPTHAASN